MCTNVVLLGRVLIDRCYSTHFSFVIFHCTKFGVTVTQLVLRYVVGLVLGFLGFLTSRRKGGRCSDLLLSDATGS